MPEVETRIFESRRFTAFLALIPSDFIIHSAMRSETHASE